MEKIQITLGGIFLTHTVYDVTHSVYVFIHSVQLQHPHTRILLWPLQTANLNTKLSMSYLHAWLH